MLEVLGLFLRQTQHFARLWGEAIKSITHIHCKPSCQTGGVSDAVGMSAYKMVTLPGVPVRV